LRGKGCHESEGKDENDTDPVLWGKGTRGEIKFARYLERAGRTTSAGQRVRPFLGRASSRGHNVKENVSERGEGVQIGWGTHHLQGEKESTRPSFNEERAKGQTSKKQENKEGTSMR